MARLVVKNIHQIDTCYNEIQSMFLKQGHHSSKVKTFEKLAELLNDQK